MARAPMLEAPTILAGRAADVPLAQHGFSALVEVRKGGRVRQLLFDTGVTPDGVRRATCAGWAGTRPTSRRSSAAMATSTTPPGCPA